MRIAICTDQYLPLLSGLVDSVEVLSEALRKRGHEVRIYAPAMADMQPDPHVFRFPLLFAPGGSVFISWPRGAMRDMRAFNPDIVHTELFGMAGFLAWHAARRLRVPLVGTDHTFPADYLHYMHLDFPPFPYLSKKFAAWYYGHCAIVTAPSENLLDELRAYGMRRQGVAISNPIAPFFRPLPNKSELKKELGIGARAIAVFGRIAEEKNIDMTLDIFAKVLKTTDSNLVFIGDGARRKVLEARAREAPFVGRVKFLGTLRGEPLARAINACDTLLITSRSETQSMTTLQALACGLSAVAADSGGLPEFVHSGENGFCVAPDDADTFAARLTELLTNANPSITSEACVRSVERFSPDNIAAQFEKIYKGVLETH